MLKLCRLATALLLLTSGMVTWAWAANAADGSLEARLQELDERFGSRRTHSGAADAWRGLVLRPESTTGDFIVNNDGFGGSSNQSQIVLARQPDGGTVVAWTDDRDANLSVYGQVFDADGIPSGPNFRLHSDPSNLDQLDPALLVRADGGFYGAFTQVKANGDRDVVVQRFSRLGQRLGGAVNVASDSLTFVQRRPSLGLLSNGDVVVLYEQDSRTVPNSSIYGRLMLKDALTRIGTKFVVSADLQVGGVTIVYDERQPSVAAGRGDTLWAAWTDNRDGGARDVFVQRLFRNTESTVVRVGAPMKANDEPVAANAFQSTPRVAAAGDGRALAVWADFRDGNWDIFKQSFEPDAARIGTNVKVNFTDGGGADQTQPAISWHDTTGVVLWSDFRGGTARVYAQRFHADGSGIGVNFAAGPVGTINQNQPAVSVAPEGDFMMGWIQKEGQLTVAYMRPVDSLDVPGVQAAVADIVISAKQVRPTCAVGAGGNVFTVWEESRAALPNIVGQAIDNSLAKPQGDQQVNDGPNVFHFLPATAVGGSVGFVVWEDYRDTIQPVYSDIYLRRYNLTASGYSAVGSNVRVIDTVESQDVRLASWNPDVATDADGNAMVVWQDNRFQSWDIFAARYSDSVDGGSGNPVRIGRNFRVDQAPTRTKQAQPRIDMNAAGQAVVIWEDTRQGAYDFSVWARIYTGAGAAPTGGEVRLDIDSTHVPRQPDVAVASDGSFALVYENHSDPGDVDVFLQRFDAAGARIPGGLGDPIRLNDDGSGASQFFPRVGATSTGFVTVWQDDRSLNWDIYAALVATGQASANANYLVNDVDATDQTVPAIAADRATNEPFICWEDLRLSETAPDVFGNRNPAVIAASVDDDGDHQGIRPDRVALGHNFPNPFNPETEIRYQLERPFEVELAIFNTLGQRVRTVVQGLQPAGEHRIVWDGRNDQGRAVATGTYLYRLSWPEGEITRKMTLLR